MTRLTYWGLHNSSMLTAGFLILLNVHFGGTSFDRRGRHHGFHGAVQALMSHQYEGLMKKANLKGQGSPGTVR
jgi:hypothetical protein